MTWKLTIWFYELRKWLGKKLKSRAKPLQGEMMFFAKVEEVDYEGKSPATIKIYFDASLDYAQCEQICQEATASFMALRRMKEKEVEANSKSFEEAKKSLNEEIKNHNAKSRKNRKTK
jgi:hypothetical protein